MAQDKIFVGRVSEQETFRTLIAAVRKRKSGDTREEREAALLLVHGHGGMGKSTLLRRFQQIIQGALEEDRGNRRRWVTVFVDLEQERDRDPAEFPLPDGPRLSNLLGRIYTELSAENRSWRRRRLITKYFSNFTRQALALYETEEQAKRLNLVYPSGVSGRLSPEQVSSTLSSVGTVGGAAADLAGAGGVGTAAGKSAGALGSLASIFSPGAKAARRGGLTEETFSALINAQEAYIRAFSDGLRNLSRKWPVAIFLDTGELYGSQGHWIREAISRSGAGTLWILGLRMESGSDPSATNEISQFRRYFSEVAFRSIQLEQFSLEALQDFMERRLGETPRQQDLEDVYDVTRGIPLAVSIALDLIKSGETPSSLYVNKGPESGNSFLVRALTKRYLVHAEQHEGLKPDLLLLFGLALLRAPGISVRVLSLLWDVPPKDLATTLTALSRRHDFVSLSGLHPFVKDTFQAYLMDPLQRPRISELVERARDGLVTEIDQQGGGVSEQLADPDAAERILNYLWFTFWVDLDLGYSAYMSLLPVVELHDREIGDNLSAIALTFGDAMSSERLTHIAALRSSGRRFSAEIDAHPSLARISRGSLNRSSRLAAFKQLENAQAISLVPPDVHAEAVAAFQIARRRSIDISNRDTVARIRKFASEFPKSRYSKAISNVALRVANSEARTASVDGRPRGSETARQAAQLAVNLAPSNADAWNELGFQSGLLGRVGEAADAFERALELEPDFAPANMNFGVVMLNRGEYQAARALTEKALVADPENSQYLSQMGLIRICLGDIEGAREVLEKSISSQSDHSHIPHVLLGAALLQTDLTAAREHFETALEVDLTDVLHFTDIEYRALAELGLGRAAEARVMLADAFSQRTPIEPRFEAVYDLFSKLDGEGVGSLIELWSNSSS